MSQNHFCFSFEKSLSDDKETASI